MSSNPLSIDISSLHSQLIIQSSHPLHKYETKEKFVSIVFNVNYDINFFQLENLHSFDCKKWGKVASLFTKYLNDNQDTKKKVKIKFKPKSIELISPGHAITDEELLAAHSQEFIKNINNDKETIANASEIIVLRVVPLFIIKSRLLTPLKWQTSGSVLAGYLALKYGYSINIGGGFHHCSSDEAGGFCLFADITLMMRLLWEQVNEDLRIMIVDLDAHQGNGYQRDAFTLVKRDQLFIFDMYNCRIYPGDGYAKGAIDKVVELECHCKDEKYLKLLKW